MSWLRRIFGTPSEAEGVRLVKLRSTRFRHLLRHYGKFLDLLGDAAEKQAGDYVLDKQYIVSMAEILFEVAETVVFDLNVMTNQRWSSFFEIMDRLHTEVKKSLASWSDDSQRPEEGAKDFVQSGKSDVSVGGDSLVEAIARYPLLYRQKGQVACRGVAAGNRSGIQSLHREKPGTITSRCHPRRPRDQTGSGAPQGHPDCRRHPYR